MLCNYNKLINKIIWFYDNLKVNTPYLARFLNSWRGSRKNAANQAAGADGDKWGSEVWLDF